MTNSIGQAVCEQVRGYVAAAFLVVLAIPAAAQDSRVEKDTRESIAPDLRAEDISLKLQRGDFVAVPIAMSNPTFGTGLIGGAAYFYPQTPEQAAVQPASLTGIAGAYTDNDSKAAAIFQQNYWNRNNWRFTGGAVVADFRLSLLAPDDRNDSPSVDWRVKGYGFLGRLSGQVWPHWYVGLQARFADVDQSLESDVIKGDIDLSILPSITSSGLGVLIEYDTRDLPTNAYSGRYFKVDALFNSEDLGSNKTYQNYNLTFSSYHRLADSVVLAWQIQGCARLGEVPLWDACSIKLRGFPATDYLGEGSASGQAEVRWKLSKRWGIVGFGGAGYSRDTYAEQSDLDWVPSYGLGLRFMVLESKRINMRLDYARSDGSDAIHFLVGEVF